MEKKASSNKKRLLLFVGIPLLLVVVLGIVAISGLNTFLKPMIKRSLSKVIVNGSDSLYTFSLKDYTIGPGGRSATINGLDIHVDSARYKLLKTAGLLPAMVVAVQVDKASVSGISPWQLWRHKNIICNSIALNGAKVSLSQQSQSTDTTNPGTPKTFYELIKPDINNIEIRHISVVDADLVFRSVKQQTQQQQTWHFDNASVILDDILVDSATHKDTTRIWNAGNLKLALGSLNMVASDGVYKLSSKSTGFNFKEQVATVEGLQITPAISKAEFSKRMGHEADLFTISIPKISIEKLNASGLLADNAIDAALVQLTSPNIDIYKDKRAGPDYSSKVGKYPHQLLLKAGVPISIRKLTIATGKLVVTQKSIKTGENGSFLFTNVNGNITNITNKPSEIAAGKWCRANLSAAFLGPNVLNAVFAFDLAATNGHFITDANLGSLKPADINPAFRALAQAELESFSLDKLAYHVEGYDSYAVGNLQLLYHDLKLNVLKKDADGNIKKKGLISLLANLLKLYDNNPMNGAERRAVNIRDERLPEKNFFGLVVRTLLKCAQEIVVKGENKTLPGMTAKKPGQKDNENKKSNKKSGKNK